MDFLEEEAVVSSGESDNEKHSDEEIKVKKNKKKKSVSKLDDNDEDEEEEDEDQNIEDLIDDNPIEDEEEEEEINSGSRKRGHSESENSDVDDEDIDLLQENTGVKFKKTRKRIRKMVESDDEEEEVDKKAGLQEKIFDTGDDDDDDIGPDVYQGGRHGRAAIAQVDEELEVEEEYGEEDEDDFIVDDEEQEGQPVPVGKKKKKRTYEDVAMQDAYEVFGGDFDFADLAEYEDDEDDDLEDEQEDPEGDARPTAKYSKKKQATVQQLYEPGELEQAYLTDYDINIRSTDMPERFQLRSIAVCPTVEGELEEEAEWIYKQAFNLPPISRQDHFDMEANYNSNKKGPSTIGKIREALNLMRNQKFEVPFIAFYRKEHIDPELNITDLWKIFHWDEKWMQLKRRKENLVRLFEQMQQFQFDQHHDDKPLESSFRHLTEEDVERIKLAQTMEQLKDIHEHFNLYYSADLVKMRSASKLARKKKLQEEGGADDAGNDEDVVVSNIKQSHKKSGYDICIEAGLIDVAQRFGLTAEQFGENLRDNYQRHEVGQDPMEPKELAEEFIKGRFSTTDEVLVGARHIASVQIAHDPLVRACVRQVFHEKCKLNVRPTPKGFSEIDESHPCFAFKYLKSKPVRELEGDQFLKIHQAEKDGLLKVDMFIDDEDMGPRHTYLEEIKQLYIRDEFSNLVQEWNKHRILAVEKAFHGLLYPSMIREIRNKLLDEAKEFVIRACCRKLYSWLKVAPYQVDQALDEEDEEFDSSHGLRIMGLAYSDADDEASFCAMIDGDGEVTDFLRMQHLSKRKNSWRKDDREMKESDLNRLKELIISKKPHVIAVGAESRKVLMLIEDLQTMVSGLEQDQQIAPVSIELVDNELSRVYAASKKAEHDLKEYPMMLRQAVSIARRLQDPLIEFSQLCNPNEDILSLKFHPLQEFVSKDVLLNNLTLEFVNRVNEVGVDVSRCIAHPHTAGLIQFVCGLGPRKGYYLLKTLKQSNSRLENRTQLVTHTQVEMGPKVFFNCAGFVKIDTSAVVDGTDTYVEVLDGSRIHPETYEWARKMAVDALEYDDATADANPNGALEEILESPDRLKDLDLDAFAVELERQGYGDKHITLYDIRAELNHRYKDLRTPYRSPTVEEKFNLLTKETPHTFFPGKLVCCKVIGIAHRKPRADQLDTANPVRNEDSGLWQCPFCQKNDFPELSDVWNHFDAGGCPGQAVGVRTILDNGVSGFIPLKLLSDSHVAHPEDRVKNNMFVNCRITKIDIERFQVELTSKSSDLADNAMKWRPPLDSYYDVIAEEEDKKKAFEKKNSKSKQSYVKRVIVHPSFQNIDYKTCEKVMESLEQGEVVIRPSSKGTDHLTLTWKVGEGVLQHVDIREENKANVFSLGKSLYIGSETFEDLDEIVARFIQPMAAFARDIMNYKYFKELEIGNLDDREAIERDILEEKKLSPSRIPYCLTLSRQMPGKFMLSYLPRRNVVHEFVTVTPDGIRYRGHMFNSLPNLIKWFKEHCMDPMPGQYYTKTPGPTPAQNYNSSRPLSTPNQAYNSSRPSSNYNFF